MPDFEHCQEHSDFHERVQHLLIADDQAHFFGKAIAAILANKPVPSEEFKQYNLMIDKHGLLRIGGRVKSTQQTLSNYYTPILLHRDSALAKALLDDVHYRKLKHYGGPSMLWGVYFCFLFQ